MRKLIGTFLVALWISIPVEAYDINNLVVQGTATLTGVATFSSTTSFSNPMPIQGDTSGTPKGSGYVGQIIGPSSGSATLSGSAVGTNIISISLPAGDWDIFGQLCFTNTGGDSTLGDYVGVNLSTTSGDRTNAVYSKAMIISYTNLQCMPTPYRHVVSASSQTVYLVGFDSWASGQNPIISGSGSLWARRKS